MTGNLGILPLLDRDTWKWETLKMKHETINAGSSVDVFKTENTPGWFIWGYSKIIGDGGEDAVITLVNDQFRIQSSIQEFYDLGIVGRGTGAPSVTRYDPESGVFNILWEPSPPIVFQEEASLSIQAPPEQDVLTDSAVLNLQVVDKEKFIESYQDVSYGKLMDKMDKLIEQQQTMQEL